MCVVKRIVFKGCIASNAFNVTFDDDDQKNFNFFDNLTRIFILYFCSANC